MAQIPHPLERWIPYKIDIKNSLITCKWLNTFDKPYVEPFFDETINRCKYLDVNLNKFSSISDLMVLEEWTEGINYVKPTVFIFHISRCGSTLVSQLLGINKRNISLAEVPFFDDILRLPFKIDKVTATDSGSLLTAAIKFYGQKRNGDEINLFIKADSWHVFFYKQIRELYADVPFVFLYRSPDEVFNSHKKRRGMQAVPGLIEPELFGINKNDILHMNQDIYTAKMIERYLSTYLEIIDNDKLSIFLNYKEGIMPIIKKISSFTNIQFDSDELLKMETRSLYHSKKPDEAFSEMQVVGKNPYLDKAFELYEALERKRY